ncbi:MAG: hypothetical protein OD814_000118 [Candidatus Alkanophagales archaeon MCA70_species_1]|nr:hypothetical protein [Candidatus Alkanophaga volatiphilum]
MGIQERFRLEVPTVTTVRAKMKDALLKMVFVRWGSNIQRRSYTGRGSGGAARSVQGTVIRWIKQGQQRIMLHS